MSTIDVTLEAQSDGTLHLPLPADAPPGPFHVKATIDPVSTPTSMPPSHGRASAFGCLRGKVWMAPDFDAPLADFADYER